MRSAPGYRGSGDGELAYIGNGGYSWSSATSSTNGVFLDFLTQGFGSGNVLSRGFGFQLRCLSE